MEEFQNEININMLCDILQDSISINQHEVLQEAMTFSQTMRSSNLESMSLLAMNKLFINYLLQKDTQQQQPQQQPQQPQQQPQQEQQEVFFPQDRLKAVKAESFLKSLTLKKQEFDSYATMVVPPSPIFLDAKCDHAASCDEMQILIDNAAKARNDELYFYANPPKIKIKIGQEIGDQEVRLEIVTPKHVAFMVPTAEAESDEHVPLKEQDAIWDAITSMEKSIETMQENIRTLKTMKTIRNPL